MCESCASLQCGRMKLGAAASTLRSTTRAGETCDAATAERPAQASTCCASSDRRRTPSTSKFCQGNGMGPLTGSLTRAEAWVRSGGRAPSGHTRRPGPRLFRGRAVLEGVGHADGLVLASEAEVTQDVAQLPLGRRPPLERQDEARDLLLHRAWASWALPSRPRAGAARARRAPRRLSRGAAALRAPSANGASHGQARYVALQLQSRKPVRLMCAARGGVRSYAKGRVVGANRRVSAAGLASARLASRPVEWENAKWGPARDPVAAGDVHAGIVAQSSHRPYKTASGGASNTAVRCTAALSSALPDPVCLPDTRLLLLRSSKWLMPRACCRGCRVGGGCLGWRCGHRRWRPAPPAAAPSLPGS